MTGAQRFAGEETMTAGVRGRAGAQNGRTARLAAALAVVLAAGGGASGFGGQDDASAVGAASAGAGVAAGAGAAGVGRADGAGAGADAAAAGAREAVEAIRCWRRIGRAAVHVGERFDMLVTCAVAETEAARVAPDLATLDPQSLAVSPFEVLEGERYDDLVRGPRRFLQYRYTLRILGEDHFGADVELPALGVRYHIERALPGGPRVEGRELTYVLPPEPVRVLALVPAESVDIRELPGATFGDAEARLFRANLAALGAVLLGVAALAAALAAGLGVQRARRGAAAAGPGRLPEGRVARAVLAELVLLRPAGGRWSAAAIGRAVAALRVAGALALGRPPAQASAVDDAAADGAEASAEAGRLAVRGGGRRAGAVWISSAVTPEHLERALPDLRAARPDAARLAEAVRDALQRFGARRYGRPAEASAEEELSAHLDGAIEALAERVRTTSGGGWPGAVRRRAASLRERVWRD